MSSKYGCEICKHKDKCDYNPFGICKEYEEEKKNEREAD